MARKYGYICDLCKDDITSPTGHYNLRTLYMVNVAGAVLNLDLCPYCYSEISDAIAEIRSHKLDLSESV